MDLEDFERYKTFKRCSSTREDNPRNDGPVQMILVESVSAIMAFNQSTVRQTEIVPLPDWTKETHPRTLTTI
jgi:hypothetical protein